MTRSIGVSLKMYFGHAAAQAWFGMVADVARTSRAVQSGAVELFVIPSFPSIPGALKTFEGTGVLVGAQDLSWADSGAFTGEVSGAELAELGVRVAEVGHAERRRLFHETDEVVAGKTSAALRNGLTPVLCIGEEERSAPAIAALEVISQLDSALEGAPAGRVIVAYEPVWAIGAAEPADAAHISVVTVALREHLGVIGREGSVIYGGSAGPGLLTTLGDSVDGLFLGRFAHEPAALAAVLEEAAVLEGAAA